MADRQPLSTSTWLSTVPDEKRFPALSADTKTEVAIVGGGIAGIWTAWQLAQKGVSSVILERNHAVTGDSGFTTAFITRVPDTSSAELKETYGQGFVNKIFSATTAAQEHFKNTIKDEGIDCDYKELPSYNCAYAENDETIAAEWDAISAADPKASLVRGGDATEAFGDIKEAIRFDGEARYHIRKFLLGLLERPLAKKHIRVFEETEATDIVVGGSGVAVKTPGGTVRANKLACATGLPHAAFSELHPLFKTRITYVLAGKPQGKMPFADCMYWDTDNPYQYYRWFDDKTIILGGADEDPANSSSIPSGDRGHAKLAQFIDQRLHEGVEVTHKWSGSLFETADGLPYFAEHPHYKGRVFVASGFGGNGMVCGCLGGTVLADLLTGTANQHAELFAWSRTGATIPKPAAKAAPAEFPQGLRTVATVGLLAVGAAILLQIRDWSGPLADPTSLHLLFLGLTATLSGIFAALGFGSSPKSPAAGASGWIAVADAAGLPQDKPHRVQAGGRTIALFKLSDGIYAIDNVCGHAGGPLNEGPYAQFVIECPWHGSKFDVRTGAVVAGPARKPQTTYETRISGGKVEVKI